MKKTILNKLILAVFIAITLFLSQSFIQQPKEVKEEYPVNLKVLSKKLTTAEVKKIMRTYTKSLGVRCKHCHVIHPDDPKNYDFVSDANPKKELARKMIKMVHDINKKYIGKITTYHLEPITCVTCHMGKVTPVFSVDSLPKVQFDSLKKG